MASLAQISATIKARRANKADQIRMPALWAGFLAHGLAFNPSGAAWRAALHVAGCAIEVVEPAPRIAEVIDR